MISVSILSKKIDFAIPVAYAIVPGFLAGALIGSDSLLAWNLIRGRAPKKGQSAPEQSPKYITPQQPSQD